MRDQNKDLLSRNVWDASLQRYGPSYWVWLRLEIKQTHWSILGRKKKYFVPFLLPPFIVQSVHYKTIGTTYEVEPKFLHYRANLEQMFKRMATDLDIQLTTTHQRLAFELKNFSLLPDGCCCLNDKGNEILFKINISPPLATIAGLDGADHWLGLPCHRTSHKWTSSYGATLKPWFIRHQLILNRIVLYVFLRQQPGIL
jgi:hypothetical protein